VLEGSLIFVEEEKRILIQILMEISIAASSQLHPASSQVAPVQIPLKAHLATIPPWNADVSCRETKLA